MIADGIFIIIYAIADFFEIISTAIVTVTYRSSFCDDRSGSLCL